MTEPDDDVRGAPRGRDLYVVGGQQRTLIGVTDQVGEWYEYEKGLILRLDVERGSAETVVEYVSPPEACPDERPAILFKSGTLEGDRFYACTQTEVLVYELPSFRLLHYVTLPIFNDVHHVRPTPDGHLLIANTGLDTVLEVSVDGQVLREWNVLGEDTWARFSRDVDYRKVRTTKPHHAHPNHVFYLEGEPWATRFEQKDAICLTRPDFRIDIGVERLHDGLVHDGRIYFTAVNGQVVIVDPAERRVVETLDLTQFHNSEVLLGWCRGVALDGDRLWVGFSRIRQTAIRENLSWVRRGFKRKMATHLACYDLREPRCVAEIDVEPFGMSAIFSVFPTEEVPT